MKYFVLAFIFLVTPSLTLAHLDGNALEDGNYRIELGQLPLKDLEAGEHIVFSTSMEQLDGNQILDINAWVRITEDDTILFSSTDFLTDDGTIDFDYTFPTAGHYEMTIRLVDVIQDEEATVTFPFDIQGSNDLVADIIKEGATNNFGLPLITLLVGLIAGSILVFIAPIRKK